jgi:hypothetical protein
MSYSGQSRIVPLALPFACLLVLAIALPVNASESCSMLGGKCRDACGTNEKAEAGDFEDCGPKQECCTVRPEVRCCVQSFAAKDFGPANCGIPVNGVCPKGSANAASCDRLPMCSTAK